MPDQLACEDTWPRCQADAENPGIFSDILTTCFNKHCKKLGVHTKLTINTSLSQLENPMEKPAADQG